MEAAYLLPDRVCFCVFECECECECECETVSGSGSVSACAVAPRPNCEVRGARREFWGASKSPSSSTLVLVPTHRAWDDVARRAFASEVDTQAQAHR